MPKRDPIVRNRIGRSGQTAGSNLFLSRLNVILDGQHAALFFGILVLFNFGLGLSKTSFEN